MTGSMPWPSAVPPWQGGVLRDREGRSGGPPVVKIGGSLLVRPGWPALLRSLLDLPACRGGLLIVGGGPVVDGLRRIDAAGGLSERLVHDLAIDAMRLTAAVVADAVGAEVVAEPAARAESPAVLDVAVWLRAGSRAGRVPVGWHVTSDSIAAVVADALSRDLILAKSVPPPACRPPHGDAVAACTSAGWVDPHFPEASAGLHRIGWVAA